MRYWWVNQKQTFTHEFKGGYLWSPKKKANGHKNPFYEFMREVSPGDLIFSYANTKILAIGMAQSHAYEASKPDEFGNAGLNWDFIGWRVNVSFVMLDDPVKPAEHIDRILPLLPPRYAPLQESGRGNQSMYLTFVPPILAELLISLIGEQAWHLRVSANRIAAKNSIDNDSVVVKGIEEWEEHLIEELRSDATLSGTERETLIVARRGQGVFKQNVLRLETRCRVTKVDRIEHLRASHIKPWRDCQDKNERLAGENGLLLTPSIDHLFDRGFISFEDSGVLLISPTAHEESLQRMGIETRKKVFVGAFAEEQKRFLDFHRDEIFLKARVEM